MITFFEESSKCFFKSFPKDKSVISRTLLAFKRNCLPCFRPIYFNQFPISQLSLSDPKPVGRSVHRAPMRPFITTLTRRRRRSSIWWLSCCSNFLSHKYLPVAKMGSRRYASKRQKSVETITEPPPPPPPLFSVPHFSGVKNPLGNSVESANVRVKSIYNTNLIRSSCRRGVADSVQVQFGDDGHFSPLLPRNATEPDRDR